MKYTIFFLLVLSSLSTCSIYRRVSYSLAIPPDVVQYEVEGSIPEGISSTSYSNDVKMDKTDEKGNFASVLSDD